MKITKDITLEKILELDSGEEILSNHGVPCMSCPMAKFELNQLKLDDVANMYGLDLDGILTDLNKK